MLLLPLNRSCSRSTTFALAAFAVVALGCSSPNHSDDSGDETSGNSVSGIVSFTPKFATMENKTSDGGVESYKVEIGLYDQPFTCGTYDSATTAYQYIKVFVENAAMTTAITPGTYAVDPSNPNNVYVHFERKANGQTVSEQDSNQGTIKLDSVVAGKSASEPSTSKWRAARAVAQWQERSVEASRPACVREPAHSGRLRRNECSCFEPRGDPTAHGVAEVTLRSALPLK
jgi:hypothetical protein